MLRTRFDKLRRERLIRLREQRVCDIVCVPFVTQESGHLVDKVLSNPVIILHHSFLLLSLSLSHSTFLSHRNCQGTEVCVSVGEKWPAKLASDMWKEFSERLTGRDRRFQAV